MRTLAEAIIAAQEAEIEQMQQWLEEWYGDGESGSIAPSPYAGDLASPVRGLTAQEVDDLLNGRGMALARMAELNNHPGPRHLLDLQAELALSPEQIAQIEEVFSTMQAEAQALGKEIVQREQALSDAFAEGTLESAALQTQVLELGDYYAQLRAVHLQAHLQVTPLLSAQQITRYNELRGYAGGEHHPHMH
jgi:Spy/CpxP family protein refolding chaperone